MQTDYLGVTVYDMNDEDITKYINFYNNERFQVNLKGMTPNQFGNHANPNLLPLVI